MLSSNPRSILKVKQARKSNHRSPNMNKTVIAEIPNYQNIQTSRNLKNSENVQNKQNQSQNTQSRPKNLPVYQRTSSFVARQRAQSSYLPIHEETSYEIQNGTLDKNRNRNNNNNFAMVKSKTDDALGRFDEDAEVYL